MPNCTPVHTHKSLLSPSAHVQGYSQCFPLGQTRQGESTSGRLRLLRGSDPWSPEHIHKLTRPNTGLSERNKTGERHRCRGVTASDQMVAWVCLCVRMCEVFSKENEASQGMAVSQRKVWWELGKGMKGWRIERWRRVVGDEGITKSWQLLFFFLLTEFIPMAVWGRKCLLLLIVTDLLLYSWYILHSSIHKISTEQRLWAAPCFKGTY